MLNLDGHDYTLIIIAVTNLVTAFLAWRTHSATMATNVLATETNGLTRQVEIATNSMKDALVAAEKKISYGEGREQGLENHASGRS